MTYTLDELRGAYLDNRLDDEDLMHKIINLQDDLATLTAERDEARTEVERLRNLLEQRVIGNWEDGAQ